MEQELTKETINQIKADLIARKNQITHDLLEISKGDHHDAV